MILPVLVSGLCGLVIGCFLNTMVYRLSTDRKTLITEDCICPVCGHRLALWEQIPIAGYLMLGGRCRYCQAPIDVHYPLVEGGCAVLYAVLAWLCLPRLWLFLLFGFGFDLLLAGILLRRMSAASTTAVRPRFGKAAASVLLLLFYHALIAAAVGIVLLSEVSGFCGFR